MLIICTFVLISSVAISQSNAHIEIDSLPRISNSFSNYKQPQSLIVFVNNLPKFADLNDTSLVKFKKRLQENARINYMRMLGDYKITMLQSVGVESFFAQYSKLKSIADPKYYYNSIRDLNTSVFRNPLKINSFFLSYEASSFPQIPDSSRFGMMQRANASFGADVFGVPFSFNYTAQNLNLYQSNTGRGIVSIKFNRKAYVEKLKAAIPVFDPGQLITPDELWNIAREKAIGIFRAEIQATLNQYKGLVDSVTVAHYLSGIFEKDGLQLSNVFQGADFVQQMKEASDFYLETKARFDAGDITDSSFVVKAEERLKYFKGINEIVSKINFFKSKWKESGLVQKVKESNLINQGKMKKVAENPSEVLKEAKNYINLSSFQKLLTKFTNLNLGTFGTEKNDLTFKNFLSTGLSGDILSEKNKYLSFIGGRQKSLFSLFDKSVGTPLITNANNLFGIVIGKGSAEERHTHISTSYFKQQLINQDALQAVAPAWSGMVLGFSNKFDLGRNSMIETELSKSTGVYGSGNKSGSPSFLSHSDQLLSASSFTSNMAVSVKYSGEYPEIDFTHQIKIAATGNSYNNPGNSFMQRGMTEGMFDLRKSFSKRKYQFTARGNFREFNFSGLENQRWRNYSFLLDGRIRFRKAQFLAVRYQPSRFLRLESGSKYTASLFSRLSVDGAMSGRFLHKPYRNIISIVYLRNGYSVSAGQLEKISSIVFTSTQTLTIGSEILNVNLTYNKANNNTGFVFFNSTLFIDGGISYSISKNVMASTYVGYNSAEGWYKQLLYRQTISGQVSQRLQFSFFADVRVNLKTEQELLYNRTRGEVSVFYQIR